MGVLFGIVVTALAAAVPVALVVLAVAGVAGGLRQQTSDAVAEDARRRVRRATAASLGVGVVVVVVLVVVDAGDVLVATAPLATGTLMVLAATLVERTWPRPEGLVRVAAVRPRPEGSRLLRRLWWGSAAGLVVTCALGTTLGAADGRRVEVVWGTGSHSHSPFPGWRYSVPILLALAVLAAAVWWGRRTVEGRPALDPDHADLDAAARVSSTARILRIAAASTLATLAPVALIMGSALATTAQALRTNEAPVALYPPLDWRQDLGLLFFAVALTALALLLVTLLAPRSTARDPGGVARPVPVAR